MENINTVPNSIQPTDSQPNLESSWRVSSLIFLILDILILGGFAFLLGQTIFHNLSSITIDRVPHIPLLMSVSFGLLFVFIYLRIRSIFACYKSPEILISSIINILTGGMLILGYVSLAAMPGSLATFVIAGYITIATLIGFGISFLVFLVGFIRKNRQPHHYVIDIIVPVLILICIVGGIIYAQKSIVNRVQVQQSTVQSSVRQDNEKIWPKESINMRKVATHQEFPTLYQERIYSLGWGGFLPEDFCCEESKDGRIGYTLNFGLNNTMVFVGNQKFGPYNGVPQPIIFDPTGNHFAYIAMTADEVMLNGRTSFDNYKTSLFLDGVAVVSSDIIYSPFAFTENGQKILYYNNSFKTMEYDISTSQANPSSLSPPVKKYFDSNFTYPQPNDPYQINHIGGYTVDFNGITSNKYDRITGNDGPYDRTSGSNKALSPDNHHLTYAAQRDRTFFAVVDNKEGPWFDYVWIPRFSSDGKSITHGAVLGNDLFIVRQDLSDFGIKTASNSTVCNDSSMVRLYQDANYQGACTAFETNIDNFVTYNINDSVSSIKIKNGYSITLYEDINHTGRIKTFTADTPYVGNDFNDIASSIRIESIK